MSKKYDSGPGNDLTVYIPRIKEPYPPIEPLFKLPAWLGKVLLSILLAGIYLVCCYLAVMIFVIWRA